MGTVCCANKPPEAKAEGGGSDANTMVAVDISDVLAKPPVKDMEAIKTPVTEQGDGAPAESQPMAAAPEGMPAKSVEDDVAVAGAAPPEINANSEQQLQTTEVDGAMQTDDHSKADVEAGPSAATAATEAAPDEPPKTDTDAKGTEPNAAPKKKTVAKKKAVAKKKEVAKKEETPKKAEAPKTEEVEIDVKARKQAWAALPKEQRADLMKRIHDGAFEGILSDVKAALEEGCDVDIQNLDPRSAGETALHFAVQKNHVAIVKLLLQYQPNKALKAKFGEWGFTPLHYAARLGSLELVELVYDPKAMAADNYIKKTPLDLAEKGGHNDVVKLMKKLEKKSKKK